MGRVRRCAVTGTMGGKPTFALTSMGWLQTFEAVMHLRRMAKSKSQLSWRKAVIQNRFPFSIVQEVARLSSAIEHRATVWPASMSRIRLQTHPSDFSRPSRCILGGWPDVGRLYRLYLEGRRVVTNKDVPNWRSRRPQMPWRETIMVTIATPPRTIK